MLSKNKYSNISFLRKIKASLYIRCGKHKTPKPQYVRHLGKSIHVLQFAVNMFVANCNTAFIFLKKCY